MLLDVKCTLTVDVDGNGHVDKDPDQASYIYGTPVELTAVADPGWTFVHWSGDLSGSTNPDIITMDDDKTVTAHFTQHQYTLTINIVGSGSVVRDPNQSTYTYGTIVELTANADTGWSFVHWSGDLTSSENPDTVVMDSNKTVTAIFKEPNIVSILPSAQAVGKGETFTVSVYVEPSEPIIGATFDYLYFNSNLIHANSVTEGDLFDPYDTLFNNGTIDNVNGVITSVYGFTFPAIAVSDPGYFCDISFTAQQINGTSLLDLEDVVISNATGVEVPFEVYNGSVTVIGSDIIPPEITDVTYITSDPLDTELGFGWEYFSCTVTDADGVDEVKLVLTGDITTEYPMIKDGDDYYCNITISTADEYTYHIWAEDIGGSENISATQPFNLPLNEDVDESGKVHFMDLVAVSLMYNNEGPPGWIREDVDNGGKVHFMDLVQVSLTYNEEW